MSARFIIIVFSILVSAPRLARCEELVTIRGAQVAAEAVIPAAARIRKDLSLELTVATDGGSSNAVEAIGENLVDVALLCRPISPREIATFPNANFVETRFGMQALLIVVPEQVWNSGVHSVTKEQIRGIYEGSLKNWKALAGEDSKILFFNRDIARTQWELLMTWLYEDLRKAPMSPAPVLEGPGAVTSALESNAGSVSLLEFNAPRNAKIRALGIKLPDGTVVEPTAANIASGRYEFARPLIIATPRKPVGKVRRFVDFMLGPAGQEFVKKAGHLPNAELVKENQPQPASR